MSTTTTELDYPDRRATHWGLTTIYAATVQVWWGQDDTADVTVATEVPRDAQEINVQRRGNRYYPSGVKVEGRDVDLDLTPAWARQLAHALLRAADVCDATDVADTDVCGHWFPCDCGCDYPEESR